MRFRGSVLHADSTRPSLCFDMVVSHRMAVIEHIQRPSHVIVGNGSQSGTRRRRVQFWRAVLNRCGALRLRQCVPVVARSIVDLQFVWKKRQHSRASSDQQQETFHAIVVITLCQLRRTTRHPLGVRARIARHVSGTLQHAAPALPRAATAPWGPFVSGSAGRFLGFPNRAPSSEPARVSICSPSLQIPHGFEPPPSRSTG